MSEIRTGSKPATGADAEPLKPAAPVPDGLVFTVGVS